MPAETPGRWPPLPYEEWSPTKETLHRYVQIVGKIRMALVPLRNHWWHATLYVTERGLSTGAMPAGDVELAISFDFVRHRLVVTTSDGRIRELDLTARPAAADFHQGLFGILDELGVAVEIHAEPYDLGESPAFTEDREHRSYDPDAVHRFWRALALTQRVLDRFRSGFAGKASPVHVFWHSFDLAHARYSGRPAPVGDVDAVSAEAYSHEVIAFGFWPGDDRRTPYPAFYSYTAPEPAGLRERALVEGAEWEDGGGGSLAVLPYEAVRGHADPDGLLLGFYRAAWRAGTEAAGWDLSAMRPRGGPAD